MKKQADEKKRPEKSTGNLEGELSEKIDLEKFLQANSGEFVNNKIHQLLSRKLKEKKIQKAELARRSSMSEVYMFQILSGRRTPSRDRMLCLCIGMGCTAEETQELLKQCSYAQLYVRFRRDAIIMYALNAHWDINRLNDLLYEKGEETLY